jgi:hypothetical protein
MCRADFDLDNAEEKVRHRRWVARHLQPSCRPVGIFAKPELTNHAINSRARGSNKQATYTDQTGHLIDQNKMSSGKLKEARRVPIISIPTRGPPP